MNAPSKLALFLFFVFSFVYMMAQETEKQRPTVGLVLSGGGAKGFAHIGVLKAIEESGLHIDYIAGTSMGAIMGGLYAMGYSPDFLENMVREQNWHELIRDKYSRKYLSIDEKGDDEKFFINIPFSKKGFGLPSGLIEAQEISLLFSYLCAPAYEVRDFSQLQTPFLCVGANLEDVTSVVFDKGDLPYALRSSMAILGYFSTTEYDGALITDGGLVDNFPALELKKRGVDIIIGIDVQSPRLERDDLHSVTSDIWHVINQHSLKAQQEAVLASDIYIHPDITGYDMMSFEKWDSLISRGEQAGRSFLPQLKALADSLNAIEYKPVKEHNTQPLKKIFIEEIEYVGLKKVSGELLNNYKRFKPGDSVSFQEINQWIHLVSGTKYFTLLRYELYPGDCGAILRLHVREAGGQSLGASLHFDSDYKAAVNLKATLRNKVIHGSKANFIMSLGSNVLISADYSVNRGMRPSLGLSLDLESIDMYRYVDGNRTSMFRFMDISLAPKIKSIYKNFVDVGLGAELEYSGQKPVIDYFSLDRIDDGYFNLFIFSKFDTRNSLYYATRGSYLSLLGKMISGISNDQTKGGLYWFGTLNWNTSIRIARRWAVRPGISLVASTAGDNPPVQYRAYLGGIEYASLPGLIPFIGVKNMSFSGNFAYVTHCELQCLIFKRKGFLIASCDIGDIQSDFLEFAKADMKIGYGITASYDSFIGPLSISLTGSNQTKGIGIFINIGYKI